MDTWSILELELSWETELNIYHNSFHYLWLNTQLAETQLTFEFLKTVKFLRHVYLFLTYFINKKFKKVKRNFLQNIKMIRLEFWPPSWIPLFPAGPGACIKKCSDRAEIIWACWHGRWQEKCQVSAQTEHIFLLTILAAILDCTQVRCAILCGR